MSATFWNRVSYVMFVVAVIGMSATFAYSSQYGNLNPRAPDASSGRVHPYNYKSIVVYLTEMELLKLHLSQGVLVVGAVGFVLGLALANRSGRPPDQGHDGRTW